MTILPFYAPSGDELEVLRTAFECRQPVMLTGPTGCGKTRLVQRLVAELGRPLITVTCHDDLTASDLVGRYLVTGGDVRWVDGPLTAAVRQGAVCYLDEVVEARRDTLAVLHSLADDRRTLFLERTGEEVAAPPEFMLIASYNPESRGILKELKPSLRQRFVTLELDYLEPAAEERVVAEESGVDAELAARLVQAATALRSAQAAGVHELPSTRVLVTAGRMVVHGLSVDAALQRCLIAPLRTTASVGEALQELLRAGQPVASAPNGSSISASRSRRWR